MQRLWHPNTPWKISFLSNIIADVKHTRIHELKTNDTRVFNQTKRMCQTKTGSVKEVQKLLSKEEKQKFTSVFAQLVEEVTQLPGMKDMSETNQWLSRILHYNIPHGKLTRGLSTVIACRYFSSDLVLDETSIELSYVLGWAAEMVHGCLIIADDIMDHGKVRRGRPCWYTIDDVGGLRAINDAFLVEGAVYFLLKKYFQDKKYYLDLMEILHDVSYKTFYGQSLDTRTCLNKNIGMFNMDLHTIIANYKTGYYSICLPTFLAMAMQRNKNEYLMKQVEKICLEIGHFYQVQDDFLDGYGDVSVTGKIGNDIQECKCSWLVVTALERATPDQRQILLNNYGQDDDVKVKKIKDLYLEMKIPELYKTYEMQTFAKISSHIEEMPPQLPKILFEGMLGKIFQKSS